MRGVAEAYSALLARRSPAERRQLAELKRLIERARAEPIVFAELGAGPGRARAAAAPFGLTIDAGQACPLFAADKAALDDPALAELWPLAALWMAYARDVDAANRTVEIGDCPDHNPRFHAWRHRQVRRCQGQLGQGADNIMHAVLAFELSAGCSVGCWFCGIAAERFRGHFEHSPANARLWRDILGASQDLFGPAVGGAFCYWGTDPCDNPDYVEFIEDFRDIVGVVPPTTTAIPLRNLELTRRVVAMGDTYGALGNRFSILNKKMLDRVHAEFSAEQLMRVDMVMQNAESSLARVYAGRARQRRPATRAEAEEKRKLDNSTIACVSGFLVNMVERSIRLISPVPASERWPLGYRTYETCHFADAADFAAVIRGMIDRHMPAAPPPHAAIRFRSELDYLAHDNGFELVATGNRFTLSGAGAALLGRLIDGGASTAATARDTLLRAGIDIFTATDLIRQLFDRGLLEEEIELQSAPAQAAA